jgi:hypothetical protein
MYQSNEIDQLAAAMAAAQAEMGAAVKGASNPFFKSKYADLGSVIQAIKPAFAAHGLSYIQMPIHEDTGVGVCTRLMHKSGQYLEQEFVLPLAKQDPQAAGSAITYARRYALQAMAGIPSEDDDANAATYVVPKAITKDQAKVIKDLIKQTDSDEARFCKAFNCDSVSQLSSDRFEVAKERLESKLG